MSVGSSHTERCLKVSEVVQTPHSLPECSSLASLEDRDGSRTVLSPGNGHHVGAARE